eukprot:4249890-Lingulodinium_polyedra.AAC.1
MAIALTRARPVHKLRDRCVSADGLLSAARHAAAARRRPERLGLGLGLGLGGAGCPTVVFRRMGSFWPRGAQQQHDDV